MNGRVSDLKRMAVHDGPGIRTTLFLKGCPLRCLWCHNPESIPKEPVLSYAARMCAGCGACVAACANGAQISGPDGHWVLHEACRACGACVDACLTGALKMVGEDIRPETAAGRLCEDRAFYNTTGGVTFSGGEPLLQSEFLVATMRILKEQNVHIAVDTCGHVPWERFEDVLPYTDLFLYDIKHIDSEKHKQGTGAGNRLILDNLNRLGAAGVQVEVRTPIIPGYNDDPETLESMARLLAGNPAVKTWRLLAYHGLEEAKYAAIGRKSPMPETPTPDGTRMQDLKANLSRLFSNVCLSSD